LVLVMAAASAMAQAASVQTKVRAMLRDKPASSARIVQRLPAGKRVTVLGRDAGGNWAHVRVGRKEGWLQMATLKGMRGEDVDASEDADDDGPVRPLAKKRGVRPEAWVSKSRYHDGEDTKLIVSVNKAELYGRPSKKGAVLGILRRGEQVQLVTRSPDRKWMNIDIGGGETAWIEARAVKPGKVQTLTPPPEESQQAEEAPPPPTTPEDARQKAKMAQAEEPPPEPEAPKRGKKAKKQEADEEPPRAKRRDSDDETPPGLAPSRSSDEEASNEDEERPKKKRKLKKMASRSSGTVVRDAWTTHGKLYITPSVRAGIAILSQRFTSNGTGALSNYESSTNAFGAQVGLGVWGTLGKYLLLGGDASYTFAGAAALKYVNPADGGIIKLSVQAHTIDAGLSAGLHFNVVGGLSLRVRLGGQMILNLIQPDVRTKLPSDRIVGMTIGLGLDAPALFTLGGRPLGAWLFGGGLVPAQRAQTVGLEDGAKSSTFGAFFGGGLSFVVMPPDRDKYKGQLAIEASYAYEFAATHYTGLSRRNNTITLADRGSAQHLIALGVGYYW
jgi:uncharacterized protein YgiM (DUF1202 family)